MKTVFSPRHHGHSGQVELVAGKIVPAFEKPSRAEFIVERVKAVSLGDITGPDEYSMHIASKVHR